MLLKKDQILAANDLTSETVDVPEWGEGAQVMMRTMTAGERDEFESGLIVKDGKGGTTQNLKNFRAKLVSICAVDETGARLFGDSDVETLAKKSSKVVNRLAEVAQKLNGIGGSQTEEAVKN